jgi:UDP-N-acetylglucosamine--N-acetylmuramyl-(pentapeptide) pyrophosphoryl-undecaprenol N-acetylglucosamine transferase
VAALLGEDAKRMQVLHLTGTDENAALVEAYAKAGLAASVRRADHHIENCYLAAGLVICRAGASTISELALFGKPAILVPLPTAAEDHQTVNARMLEQRAAGRHLTQGQATPETVTRLVRDWLDAPDKWADLGKRIREIASSNATNAVVDLLLQSLHAKRRDR